MNKKILKIIGIILVCGILLTIMTGCGKKNETKENTNIRAEKEKIIKDFVQYINDKETTKVVDLIDIDEYNKTTKMEIDKQQLEIILEGINVDSYEVSNIRKATEEDIRNVAINYEGYDNFIKTYEDYEKYAVNYKLSIDGSIAESTDIFFIKEENETATLLTSKVWQGIIAYNYMMNSRALEEQI